MALRMATSSFASGKLTGGVLGNEILFILLILNGSSSIVLFSYCHTGLHISERRMLSHPKNNITLLICQYRQMKNEPLGVRNVVTAIEKEVVSAMV